LVEASDDREAAEVHGAYAYRRTTTAEVQFTQGSIISSVAQARFVPQEAGVPRLRPVRPQGHTWEPGGIGRRSGPGGVRSAACAGLRVRQQAG